MGPLGRVYKAPESFRGSLAFYQRKYGDLLAIARKKGNPHMLITFTADRSMPEFRRLLLTGQCHHDRPDCTCRLFMDKVDEFILDVEVRQIFGPIKTWSFSLEFQKGFVTPFLLPMLFKFFTILLTFFPVECRIFTFC